MPTRACCLLIPLALHLPSCASAAIVHRCEDTSGHITFTTLGCTQQQSLRIQRADNPAPGGKTRTATQKPAPQAKSNAPRELIVVGEHDDGCGNQLDAKARRQAIIRQQVRPGMSRQEVESALGRPDRIITSNSATRYHYNLKKGRSSLVLFDEKGCVKR
ncbi:outer membrane protein assembly factor BamE domain-containing protein [Pseudomonas gingeri]|uniref:Outer membrane protein assembly factor BamE n=1 Tax=Pseudomonas gingeri TaxID=117681 RepID=A0A7Y7YDZ9_9PSED|nr:outer membrane protein assembly factor BamE [Pseudomonas gingeri]NWA05443.1 outer membrane protein assembly factor BamE [Pseudomonas gingeri]NWA18098.1 outer membrane protein assembly factor BamE [Pseudomonas gingeri]NWA59062.1 outer membrane protein assembly factor BamE [Pseudomonas gingeri]NWA99614.1 outer membrane protein assembly factor BamE [Pseudomonas gingeri]NWB06169.1 outer membrane protein assembly factor BamE [Pseudomonas gingeri]